MGRGGGLTADGLGRSARVMRGGVGGRGVFVGWEDGWL
jgi:hypothetical protein